VKNTLMIHILSPVIKTKNRWLYAYENALAG